MQTRRPCRGAAPTHPFVKRQIALACTWTLLAGIGTGAALAQGPTAPVALKEVTVSATAETPESLPAAAPGGQVARGTRLGVLGTAPAATSSGPPSACSKALA